MKKEKFITYCFDDLEDIILSTAFKDTHNGFYVDIGANNPVSQSVTKYLYDNRNWHGINIEPLKHEYLLLCKDRPKDINLNMGVSDKQSELTLYIDGGTSTFNKNVINTNKNTNLMNTINIKVYTLTEILDKYLEKGTDIFFCKIDVEGFEKKVLTGLDFNKYRPFLFCIESTIPNTDIPSYDQWENILINNGYSLVFSYNVNRYYADTTCRIYDVINKNLYSKYKITNDIKQINKENKIIKKLKILYRILLPCCIREKVYYSYTRKITTKKRAKSLLNRFNLKYNIKVGVTK